MKYAGAKEGVMNGGGRPPRLLEQVRAAVRLGHCSRCTELRLKETEAIWPVFDCD